MSSPSPRHEPKSVPEAAPGVAIPAVARVEVGTLAWIPHAQTEAEDLLVTEAFRFLATPGAVPREKARDLGRALGRAATPEQTDEFLRAFSHLGLGTIELQERAAGRHVFVGHDLAVEKVPDPPACAIALGFLEGLVGAVTGRATLGAEITCRGRGQRECRFLVMERG